MVLAGGGSGCAGAWYFGYYGLLIGVVGFAVVGLLLLLWALFFYTCPRCGRRLATEPEAVEYPSRLIHRCQECDMAWESGFQIESDNGH